MGSAREDMSEIVNLPEGYWPEIEDMPGNLQQISRAIEEHIPGQGVRLTLLLAQIFPGQNIYIRSAVSFIRNWRNDRIRADYDRGGVTAAELAYKYRLSNRQIHTILSQQS